MLCNKNELYAFWGEAMATTVILRHPKTGIVKNGYYGFAWTILFFGGFPPLFRGDWILGLVLIVLEVLTWGIAGLIAAFIYNKHYTIKLIEQGYELADTESANVLARAALGIALMRTSAQKV
jgi:hypothetical protein